MKRRLAAILVADVVGYSSLMEADEEGTVVRLAACRAVIDSQVAECEGRVFKAMGDAVLAEFASPINAVRCAAGIRSGLVLGEQGVENPFRMRFGLHLADVLVEGDDLIGDGVNLAARIQQNAEPDAIDISAPLFEQVRRTSPYAFDDLGERSFHNIGEPIRVYRLRSEIERHVYQITPTQVEPSRTKQPNSLAVLPIEVPSDNEDQRFLADGITEELIFELGRFKKLFVTSRSATRSLAAFETDPQSIGDRLGVRYVLSGTIRQLGPRVRFSLTLSETDTGSVVWNDRLSQSFDELVERLDDVTSRIASTVLGRIEENDIATSRRLKPESMTAYEFHLRGLENHRLGGITDENLRQAISWFDRAIDADPNFSRPRAMWVCARAGLPDFDWDDGERRTQRALELDPNDPDANRVMGSIKMNQGEFEVSRQYHEKAMELSPSDAYIKGRSAAFFNFAGEPDMALKLLDDAEELDPFLHVWCIEERAAALYTLNRFEEAVESARGLTFQTRRSRIYRAASRVALGDIDRARRIITEAVASAPDLTAGFVSKQEMYRDPEVTRTLIERLTTAGLPQGASVVAA